MIDVSLVMFDCGEDVDQTVRTINHCATLLPFKEVRCFLYKKPSINPRCDWWIMPDASYYIGKGKVHGILPLMFTSGHILYIQNDGYPINPQLWNNDWLNLDYIAPPWPDSYSRTRPWKDSHHRMGCGGFCLKSKEFCKNSANLLKKHDLSAPVDVAESHLFYREMVTLGMKYATVAEGIRFGLEAPVEEFPGWKLSDCFGFHDTKINPSMKKIW